jgi:ankyrin repeat protein
MRRAPAIVKHSRKASVEIEKSKKKSPVLTPPQIFHRAAQQGDLDTCQRMGDKWLASKTALGNTALHWASAAGHLEVVRFLIQTGADLHMTNDMLDTPLHSAAWRGFAETAQILLTAGCSRDAVNKEGKTPPELAAQRFPESHNIIQVLPKFTEEELAEVPFALSDEEDDDVEDSVSF